MCFSQHTATVVRSARLKDSSTRWWNRVLSWGATCQWSTTAKTVRHCIPQPGWAINVMSLFNMHGFNTGQTSVALFLAYENIPEVPSLNIYTMKIYLCLSVFQGHVGWSGTLLHVRSFPPCRALTVCEQRGWCLSWCHHQSPVAVAFAQRKPYLQAECWWQPCYLSTQSRGVSKSLIIQVWTLKLQNKMI